MLLFHPELLIVSKEFLNFLLMFSDLLNYLIIQNRLLNIDRDLEWHLHRHLNNLLLAHFIRPVDINRAINIDRLLEVNRLLDDGRHIKLIIIVPFPVYLSLFR